MGSTYFPSLPLPQPSPDFHATGKRPRIVGSELITLRLPLLGSLDPKRLLQGHYPLGRLLGHIHLQAPATALPTTGPRNPGEGHCIPGKGLWGEARG